MSAHFTHVNLIAADWRRLSLFYQDVFGCIPVPPERDLSGPVLEAGTGVPGAALKGAHLRLPGWGEDGPTLEIFQYSEELERPGPGLNRPGYGHIAFAVADVAAAREVVLAAGGRAVGAVVETKIADGTIITWAYVTDPEGNGIELQSKRRR